MERELFYDDVTSYEAQRKCQVSEEEEESSGGSHTYESLADELLKAEQASATHSDVDACDDVTFDRTLQAEIKLDAHLSLDALMRMTPKFEGRDLVKVACKHLLVSKLKSQHSVRTFFSDHVIDAFERLVSDNWFDFDTLATLYVCGAIANSDDAFEICRVVDKEVVETHLKDICSSPDWKKLGNISCSPFLPPPTHLSTP